jgi:hypothetical protein
VRPLEVELRGRGEEEGERGNKESKWRSNNMSTKLVFAVIIEKYYNIFKSAQTKICFQPTCGFLVSTAQA